MHYLSTWVELSPAVLVFVVFCALVAGVCRGFAGFGLSALIVTSLTLILLPQEVVPIALLLEMFASVLMARMTWSAIKWTLLWKLMAGAILGVPAGVLILKFVAPDPLRIIISLLVLAASMALLFGRKIVLKESSTRNVSIGIFSGVANGAASAGGLPVAIYMMAVALSAETVRATLNLYFFLIDLYGTGALIYAGLFPQVTLARAALLLPPVILGIWLGNTFFKRSSATLYRYFVLGLLILLACIGLIKTMI